MSAALPAAIRGITDADALSELAEAIRAAAQPSLQAIGRYCRTTVRGHDDWDAANLVAHVDRELEHATVACIRAGTIDEAQAQAIRCAEAACLLGDDEAEHVAELVADAVAMDAAARNPDAAIAALAEGRDVLQAVPA